MYSPVGGPHPAAGKEKKLMDDGTLATAEDLYRIGRWGEGFFGVDDAGRMQVLPVIGNDTVRITIQEVVEELTEKNVQFPIVLRFHDILKNRVRQINESFATAITDAAVVVVRGAVSGRDRGDRNGCIFDPDGADLGRGRPTTCAWRHA